MQCFIIISLLGVPLFLESNKIGHSYPSAYPSGGFHDVLIWEALNLLGSDSTNITHPFYLLRSEIVALPTDYKDALNKIIADKYVDVEIRTLHALQQYHYIPIPKRIRRFFPGYKLPFSLETDIGEVKTHVSSAPKGTHIGDPDKGAYIQSRLKNWFDSHQTDLKIGATLRIQALEAGRRYKLSINKR